MSTIVKLELRSPTQRAHELGHHLAGRANSRYPLLDLVAYRHSAQSDGLPWHCLDGAVAAMLCFGEDVVKISRGQELQTNGGDMEIS